MECLGISFNGMLGNYVFEKVNKFYKISFIYLLPFCFVSVSDFSFVVINFLICFSDETSRHIKIHYKS